MGDRMSWCEIYFRITDKHGTSWVESRMAWDADRLTESVYEQHEKEDGNALRITREQYLQAKAASVL